MAVDQRVLNILSTPDDEIPQKFEEEDSFASMLERSVNQFKGSFGAGIRTIGDATGIQTIEDFGQEVLDEAVNEAVWLGQPDISSFTEIEDIGDVGEYIQYAITQAIPSMGASLASGATGSMVGLGVAGPPGAVAGGILGAFLPSFIGNTGQVALEVQERGGDPDESSLAIVAAGTLMGGLDVAGVATMLRPIAGPLIKQFGIDAVGNELVKMGVGQAAAKGALAGLVAEGVTEAAQEDISMTMAGYLTGTEMPIDEMAERIGNAFLIGGIAGGGLGAFGGANGAIINNSEFKAMSELKGRMEERRRVAVEDMLEQMAGAGGQAFGMTDHIATVSDAAFLLDPEVHNYVYASKKHLKNINQPGFWGTVADALTNKAVSFLDAASTVSPSMRDIRNSFMREEGPGSPLGFDIFEEAAVSVGQRLYKLHGIMANVQNKEELDLFTRALRDNRLLPNLEPRLQQAARDTRDILNEIHQEAKSLGLNTGFITDFLPRYYNVDLLRKDEGARQRLRDLAKQYGGFPDNVINAALEKITRGTGIILDEDILRHRVTDEDLQDIIAGNKLQNKRVSRLETTPKNRSLENSRILSAIPDNALHDAGLIISNPWDIISEYVRAASKRLVYVRQFGKNEERLTASLLQAAGEMRDAGRPMTRNELDRVYMLADAYNGMYKPITHPSFQNMNNLMVLYQFIRLLPLALLSSLSEPWVIVERSGGEGKAQLAKALLQGISSPIRKFVAPLRNMPFDEAKQWAEEAGAALDYAATERASATFAGNPEAVRGTIKVPFTSKEISVARITDRFFKINLLGPFTKFNRILAYGAATRMLESHARRLANQEAPVGSKRWNRWAAEIRELGLDPRELIAWQQAGANKADPYFKQRMLLAANRFTNEVVMHPQPNNRPFWQSNPHFALIAQLKGFQTVFGNTVVKRWIRKVFQSPLYEGIKNGHAIAGTAIMMTMTALLMNELRELITYGPEGAPSRKNDTAEKKLFRALERIGIFGAAQFGIDAMNAHKFGAGPLDPILGPTVSQTLELAEGVSTLAFGGSPQKLVTETLKAIPGMSLSPLIRQKMTEGITGIQP